MSEMRCNIFGVNRAIIGVVLFSRVYKRSCNDKILRSRAYNT